MFSHATLIRRGRNHTPHSPLLEEAYSGGPAQSRFAEAVFVVATPGVGMRWNTDVVFSQLGSDLRVADIHDNFLPEKKRKENMLIDILYSRTFTSNIKLASGFWIPISYTFCLQVLY